MLTARTTAHAGHLLYVMAPAYTANMAPPLVKFWHGWNRPISAGLAG
jgi:CDP-2,3-bis-(O-geranylgeranyl)-sn-glycerol synthase